MGGNYYHDPRPFYDLNHHNLISMDELFYGRKEPPPWYMHQQYGHHYDQHRSRSMEPQGHHYDQHRSRSVEPQRPGGHYISEDQFRRPDMRQDIYMGDYPYGMQGYYNMQGHHNGQGGHNNGQQQQKGGNNHGGNNHGGNNNNHGGNNNNNNKAKNQQKHQNDSDDDDNGRSHKGGNNHGNNGNNHGNKGGNNKGHGNDHSSHGHNSSWSDNRGFHGGRSHRRSQSFTQTVLKKLGFRDSSSDESSDDERYNSRNKNTRGGHGPVHTKSDHKPYTVRFDDQSYNHSNKASHQKLGEDHGSHGKKNNGGGGQPQGILKTSKNKHGDDGYSSDDENRGNQKNNGNNNNNNNKQGKQLGRSQSMDFRVNLCCDNCERKVKKALRKLDVDQVLFDQYKNKVMVTGNAKPESILKKLKSVKRDTLMWHSHK